MTVTIIVFTVEAGVELFDHTDEANFLGLGTESLVHLHC
jgi:hypothetical protein